MFLLPPEPQTVWLAAVSLRARKHAATSCGRRTKECWWFWDLCTTINVFPTKNVGGGWLKKKNPTLLLETFEVRGGESRGQRSSGRWDGNIWRPNFTTPSCKTESGKRTQLQKVPADVVKWLKRTVRGKETVKMFTSLWVDRWYLSF